MPDPKTTAPNDIYADSLRLVLFGLPAAGKSSLLGALAASARSQEPLLGGKLVDRSHGLTELARSLYSEGTKQTPEEVVPYPVEYDPLAGEGASYGQEKVEAVLVDCDGQVANDLLQHKRTLDDSSPAGTLIHEVVEADTLILVVDSSTTAANLEEDFAEFNRFLKIMEHDRGKRVEVGGLPVFLVLTKCDLLARPGDGTAAWMERIEQRKREVDAHFREFLARGEDEPRITVPAPETLESPMQEDPHALLTPMSAEADGRFGDIDLHVWATAVKRPPLAGAPTGNQEPYGVAELFRQCLREAQDYRQRCERSSRRVVGTVAASALLAAGMLVLAVTLLIINRNSLLAMLQARVEDFQALDSGGPAHYLRGTLVDLKDKQARLQEIRDNPQFHSLKSELRAFVEQRLEELAAYIAYYEKVIEERPPYSERTQEGLDQRIERLKKELAVPREDWAGTEAALMVRQRLDAAEALRRGVQEIRNWYLDAAEAAAKLWTFAGYTSAADIDWGEWTAQAEKLVEQGRKPPFPEDQPLPGAPGSLLTYGTAMRFDKVLAARVTYDTERSRLRRVLEICSALGLATTSKERPAVLVIPRGITLAACRTRVAELKSAYPDFPTVFVRDTIPELILPRLRQVVRSQYHILLAPAHAEVLNHLHRADKGKEETLASWETVRTWLRDPEELSAWRVLAGVLLHLEDPAAEDPVTKLSDFLGKKHFTIEARTLTLEIAALRGIAPRTESRLIVRHQTGDRQETLAFEPSGEPRRDSGRRVVVYLFRLAEGQRLVYRPGDKLWAELPLRGGKERLVWSQSRSALYQFDRLRNPPRLQPIDAASLAEGRLLDDVRLSITPDEGVPRVPDLMPSP